MENLNVGDCVVVNDPGLLQLQAIMGKICSGYMPNNIGWIHEIWDDEYLIEFPIGKDNPNEHSQVAPYPKSFVRINSKGISREDYIKTYFARNESEE